MVLFKVSMSGLHQIQIPVPSQVSLSMHMIKLFLQSLIILQLQMYVAINSFAYFQGINVDDDLLAYYSCSFLLPDQQTRR